MWIKLRIGLCWCSLFLWTLETLTCSSDHFFVPPLGFGASLCAVPQSLSLAAPPAVIHCCYSWRFVRVLVWHGGVVSNILSLSFWGVGFTNASAPLQIQGSPQSLPSAAVGIHSVLSQHPWGPSPWRLNIFWGKVGGAGWNSLSSGAMVFYQHPQNMSFPMQNKPFVPERRRVCSGSSASTPNLRVFSGFSLILPVRASWGSWRESSQKGGNLSARELHTLKSVHTQPPEIC